MRRLAVALAIVTLGVTAVAPAAAKVETLREQIAGIERRASGYRQVTCDLADGYCTDGGTVVGHYDGKVLKKITAKYYGESGRQVEEYYFPSGPLAFMVRTRFDYNLPYYMVGGGRIAKTTTERWYFQRGQLARWVDSRGRSQQATKVQQDEVLKQAAEFRKMLATSRVALPSLPLPSKLAKTLDVKK